MRIFTFFSCLLISSTAFSQDDDLFIFQDTPTGRAFLDVIPEMEIAFPLGGFKSKLDKTALVGKGIYIFYRLKNQPVDIGLRLGDIPYDNVRRNFTDSIDFIKLVQKSKNKIWLWYGAMRYEPELKLPFKLYFEASFGFNRFYTKTFTKERGLTSNDDDEDLRWDRATLNSDWGKTYGGAVGTKIFLDSNGNSALDLQFGYRGSDVGTFYVKNNLEQVQVEPLDNFDERQGPISMFLFKIGLSILGFSNN